MAVAASLAIVGTASAAATGYAHWGWACALTGAGNGTALRAPAAASASREACLAAALAAPLAYAASFENGTCTIAHYAVPGTGAYVDRNANACVASPGSLFYDRYGTAGRSPFYAGTDRVEAVPEPAPAAPMAACGSAPPASSAGCAWVHDALWPPGGANYTASGCVEAAYAAGAAVAAWDQATGMCWPVSQPRYYAPPIAACPAPPDGLPFPGRSALLLPVDADCRGALRALPGFQARGRRPVSPELAPGDRLELEGPEALGAPYAWRAVVELLSPGPAGALTAALGAGPALRVASPGTWELRAWRDEDGMVGSSALPAGPGAAAGAAAPLAFRAPGACSEPSACGARGAWSPLPEDALEVAAPACPGANATFYPSNATLALPAAVPAGSLRVSVVGPCACAAAEVRTARPALAGSYAAGRYADGAGLQTLADPAAPIAFPASPRNAYVVLRFDPPARLDALRVWSLAGPPLAWAALEGGATAAPAPGACGDLLELSGPAAPVAAARLFLRFANASSNSSAAAAAGPLVRVEAAGARGAAELPRGTEPDPAPGPGPARASLRLDGGGSARILAASFWSLPAPSAASLLAAAPAPAPAPAPVVLRGRRAALCSVVAPAEGEAACFLAVLVDDLAWGGHWDAARGRCCVARAEPGSPYRASPHAHPPDAEVDPSSALLVRFGDGAGGEPYAGERPDLVAAVECRPANASRWALARALGDPSPTGWVSAISGRAPPRPTLLLDEQPAFPVLYASGAWRASARLVDTGLRDLGDGRLLAACSAPADPAHLGFVASGAEPPPDAPAEYAKVAVDAYWPGRTEEVAGAVADGPACARAMLARPLAAAAAYAYDRRACTIYLAPEGTLPWASPLAARVESAPSSVLYDRYGALRARSDVRGTELSAARAPPRPAACAPAGFVGYRLVPWGPRAPRLGRATRAAATFLDCVRFGLTHRARYLAVAREGDLRSGPGSLLCVAVAADRERSVDEDPSAAVPEGRAARARPLASPWGPAPAGVASLPAPPRNLSTFALFDLWQLADAGRGAAYSACAPSGSLPAPSASAGAPRERSPWSLPAASLASAGLRPGRVTPASREEDCAAALDSDPDASVAEWRREAGECRAYLDAHDAHDAAAAADGASAVPDPFAVLLGKLAPAPAAAAPRDYRGPAAPPAFPCAYAGYAGCFALDAEPGVTAAEEAPFAVRSYRECAAAARAANASLFALGSGLLGGGLLDCTLVGAPEHWATLGARALDEGEHCAALVPGPGPARPVRAGSPGRPVRPAGASAARPAALYALRDDLDWCGACAGPAAACKEHGSYSRVVARPDGAGARLLRLAAASCAYGDACAGAPSECSGPGGACAPIPGEAWRDAEGVPSPGTDLAEVAPGVYSAVRCSYAPLGGAPRVMTCADPLNSGARMACDPRVGCVAAGYAPGRSLEFDFRGGPPVDPAVAGRSVDVAAVLARGGGGFVPCVSPSGRPRSCAAWCLRLYTAGEDARALEFAPYVFNQTCDLRAGAAWTCRNGCVPDGEGYHDYAIAPRARAAPEPLPVSLPPELLRSNATVDARGEYVVRPALACDGSVARYVRSYVRCLSPSYALVACDRHPVYATNCTAEGACAPAVALGPLVAGAGCPYQPPPRPAPKPLPRCDVQDVSTGAWGEVRCPNATECVPVSGCVPDRSAAAAPAWSTFTDAVGNVHAHIGGVATALACAARACPDPRAGVAYACDRTAGCVPVGWIGAGAAAGGPARPGAAAECDLCGACGANRTEPACAVAANATVVGWSSPVGRARVAAWASVPYEAVAEVGPGALAHAVYAPREAALRAVALAWSEGIGGALLPAPAFVAPPNVGGGAGGGAEAAVASAIPWILYAGVSAGAAAAIGAVVLGASLLRGGSDPSGAASVSAASDDAGSKPRSAGARRLGFRLL